MGWVSRKRVGSQSPTSPVAVRGGGGTLTAMAPVPASRSALRQHATQVTDTIWEIPPTAKPGMRVSARIYASAELFAQLDDGVFEQVTNVAMLPGIVGHVFCMPDGHWGYGFPIGGVAALNPDQGVISPGGTLPDRDLACAPFSSPEGQAYFAAMKCGINMSFANRQMIASHPGSLRRRSGQ